jgi:hypothetical protein
LHKFSLIYCPIRPSLSLMQSCSNKHNKHHGHSKSLEMPSHSKSQKEQVWLLYPCFVQVMYMLVVHAYITCTNFVQIPVSNSNSVDTTIYMSYRSSYNFEGIKLGRDLEVLVLVFRPSNFDIDPLYSTRLSSHICA